MKTFFINGVLQYPDGYRLETETGKVFGETYHVAKPINAEHKWPAMMAWMIETFGPTAKDGIWTPHQTWYANNARFWFRHREDLLLFTLKWS